MTMIEKLARAIASNLGATFDDAFDSKADWISARGMAGGAFREINEPFKRDYLEAARAVLQSLREPSEGMEEAGAQAWIGGSLGESLQVSFTAMIDHALGEG